MHYNWLKFLQFHRQRMVSKVASKLHLPVLCVFTHLIFVSQVHAWESHFSSNAWRQSYNDAQKSASNTGKFSDKEHTDFNRLDEFRRFLRDYDLIGMTRNQVEELLGKENEPGRYALMLGMDNELSMELKYSNGVVECWRFCGFRLEQLDWQYKNVICVGLEIKLIPKYTR